MSEEVNDGDATKKRAVAAIVGMIEEMAKAFARCGDVRFRGRDISEILRSSAKAAVEVANER
jgi:hypothetical protein